MIRDYKKDTVLFISSYPPRECGIATYTQDLMNAINERFGNSFSLKVCALEANGIKLDYGNEVMFSLDTFRSSRYIELAEEINTNQDIKLVFMQHEFGLYAGHYGEHVLQFLKVLLKPVIASFHTVLSGPDKERKNVVCEMSKALSQIVVMTKHAGEILINEYGIPEKKIKTIFHGTHLIKGSEKETIREKFGLKNKYVLSTFGLLSSGKCIETALEALPSIIEKFPNVIYLILGKTHPEVLKYEKEKYRDFLKEKINDLKIEKYVRFINRYLSLDELLGYLQATDVYLFTSKDPYQTVSGTFSYAMGSSCPIISTPIPHAREMLNNDCGIIVDFNSSQQLARAAIDLLYDPLKRKRMSLNALHKIYSTSWQNSAVAHVHLFEKVIGRKEPLVYSIPPLSFDHLKKLTTKAGIVQFAEITEPDIESGYTLDDNARALIAAIWNYELNPSPELVNLIDIYLNYIKFSQQADGSFLNYVDENGKYHEKNHYVNLEDSMGRAIWALGEFISKGDMLHGYFKGRAENILKKAMDRIKTFKSPRAIAFSIKGLYRYYMKERGIEIQCLISELADNLMEKYKAIVDRKWRWFENYLTYANSVLPEALLYAYLATGNKNYQEIAESSFDFLLATIFVENKIKVVSNRTWQKKNELPGSFGEQPIDVAYTILALDLFYRVSGNNEYRRKMNVAFEWFLGNNHLRQIIYNPVTGGCHDGLEEHNVNLNQGAESTVCYLLSRLVMEKHISSKRKEYNEIFIHDLNQMPAFESVS